MAVFTQWHNEIDFAPLWLGYYSQFFAPRDIYVIHLLKPRPVDFDSWLPSQTGFVRIPTIDEQACDVRFLVDRAMDFQKQLLEVYECVLFAEADEFIVHKDGLCAYISEWLFRNSWSSQNSIEVCKGYEIVHHFDGPDAEPPIDLSRPILAQRRWWRPCHLYDKPLLSRIPLYWHLGFHYCNEVPWETTDPELMLIHAHKIDLDVCLKRKRERAKNKDMSELAEDHPVMESAGWQHYVPEDQLRLWFGLSLDTGEPIQDTEIPGHVRQLPL